MSSPPPVDVPKTYGALLLGALFASFLSGVTTVQVLAYFKMFPSDPKLMKFLVFFVWALDIVHSSMIWNGLWSWFIAYFGDREKVLIIPLSISLTVVFTAVPTFIVHSYYVHRIFFLSGRKYWLAVPILIIAVCRVVSACSCSAEMIRLGNFVVFRKEFQWLFSLGLALSCAVDILITFSLFTLLWTSRSRSLSLHSVLDSLILYTLELGSLTGCATIVAMICWLAEHGNLIFMGLYFVIAKLYSNSMLASLNTREHLRRAHAKSSSTQLKNSLRSPRKQQFSDHTADDNPLVESPNGRTVHVNVEKSIEYDDNHPVVQEIASYTSQEISYGSQRETPMYPSRRNQEISYASQGEIASYASQRSQ